MRKVINKSAVSSGIGIAKALVYKPFTPVISETKIAKNAVDDQINLFLKARKKAYDEISFLIVKLKEVNQTQADILTAHLELVNDIAILEEVKRLIENELYSVSKAVSISYNTFIDYFTQLEDELFQARASDLKDVKLRILRILENKPEKNLSAISEEVIIIANDLYPSDTANMNKDKIKGIITEVGGATSHTAIIAKSYDIPAILGVNNVLNEIKDNQIVILDGINGKIIINPTKEELKDYTRKQENYLAEQTLINEYLNKKSYTKDNKKIEIHLNIGSLSKQELDGEPFVDGVGLFRSEFLFMESSSFPSEEIQFESYKKVVTHFKGKPVILRTLDIGGDKSLPYLDLPKEDNPFLGNRALRLSFTHKKMFKTQIKAALRAALFGDLWLMIPMVASMDDIYKSKEIIAEAKSELKAQNIEFGPMKFGVMIEIPSLALIAEKVAKEVDFASIGTNDLCQYLTAVDRLNPYVEKYYQNHSPALYRSVNLCVKAFKDLNKPLSVCGELGGDLIGAAVLIGLGIDKLSMAKSKVAAVKKMISTHRMKEFSDMALKVLDFNTEKEVLQFMKEKLNEE